MPHGEPCSRGEEGEPVKQIETPVRSAVLDLRNWLPQKWYVDSFHSLLPASPSVAAPPHCFHLKQPAPKLST